ncbi:MAG TPA: acyl-CoA dehydrogenase family protein [Candidatus Binataceae bacterium]|nr:acyl-CoA dehydrogenase family protein [Candidatus Binataceae bacterium]
MDGYNELQADLPKEIESLRENVRHFAKNVLRPASISLDKMSDPADTLTANSPLRDVYRQAYQLGYHLASAPAETGGLGLNALGRHVFIEEMAVGAVDLALSLVITPFPFSIAAMSHNPELIDRFVKPFMADREGKMIGCWAITEPQHGSDTLRPGTPQFRNSRISGQVVARLDGDSWVINGQKSAWCSNGPIATHCALYLTTEPAQGMAGGGIACVPLDLPGVSKGKPLDKIGQRGLCQGEIFFDNVRIPRNWMVVESAGYEMVLGRTLCHANTTMAVAFTGLARSAFEAALEYSKERVQGGRPICEHQLIQKRLFEMFTKVEACRALSRRVIEYNESSPMPFVEYAIAAKTFCTQASFEVASDAVQTFGGYGLSKEYPIEKLFRDARSSLIEDGTNEVLSLTGARNILNRDGVTPHPEGN